MDLDNIKKQAQQELEQERHRDAVKKYKEKLKNKKSIWDRIFPYKLIVIKKENDNV